MNTAVADAPAQGTEVDLFKAFTPVAVLTESETRSEFYEKLRTLVDAHEPDLTTEKGRKAIASLAYKVARSKTAIDDAGKKLTEEARAQIKTIDETRRQIREQLDELKEEARRPLTEWEAAEEKRAEDARTQLVFIRDSARIDLDATATDIQNRLNALASLEIDDDLHREQAGVARAALEDTRSALEAAAARLKREEQERAELTRLREEAAQREAEEAEKRAKEEEARRAEEAEKAEAERIKRLEKEAEARAKAEAERKHQEELAEAQRRADAAERAAQEERDRLAREEQERAAAAQREADEKARREADRAHRGKVMGAAKEAIMEAASIDEATAKTIVLAIAAGNVPSVAIQF